MDNSLLIFSLLVFCSVVTKLTVTKVYPFFKPLPILMILLLAFLRPVFPDKLWLAAVLFGLIGDLWLLSEKGFIPGLLSFLLGHIFYVFAFAARTDGINFPWVYVALSVTVSLFAFIYLAQNLVKARKKRYILPILFYITVTALLLIFALRSAAVLAIVGAVFFALSDFLLAFDKFIRRTWYVQATVSVTYYAAQWLLALYFTR